MKKDIHPTYHNDAVISCACGATFKVGSTSSSITVDLCSKCHPFYTGKQKLVDTAGRVEKFEEKIKKASAAKDKAAKRKAAQAAFKAKKNEESKVVAKKDAKASGKAKKDATRAKAAKEDAKKKTTKSKKEA